MKRHAALIGLSQDHHHGLLLARRCIEEKTTWADVVQTFETELEPHFQIEEKLLLPALGDHPLVERTLSDHAILRSQIEQKESLTDFGQALERHIRFEERELFEHAQATMSEHQLAALEQAWPKASER